VTEARAEYIDGRAKLSSASLAQALPSLPKPAQNPATLAWIDAGAPRLDWLLKKRGLTNAQVGKALAMDPTAISRFRNGRRVPDADQLAAMVVLARGSVDDVLGITSEGVLRIPERTMDDALEQRLARSARRVQAAANDVGVAAEMLRRRKR
jgi:transcriptional regulator with XRE-family HTH domain